MTDFPENVNEKLGLCFYLRFPFGQECPIYRVVCDVRKSKVQACLNLTSINLYDKIFTVLFYISLKTKPTATVSLNRPFLLISLSYKSCVYRFTVMIFET